MNLETEGHTFKKINKIFLYSHFSFKESRTREKVRTR